MTFRTSIALAGRTGSSRRAHVRSRGLEVSGPWRHEGKTMSQSLDQLLAQYENGRISRRELLGALALLTAGAAAPAPAAAAPIGSVASFNHVSVFVPDVQKSVTFYQDLF